MKEPRPGVVLIATLLLLLALALLAAGLVWSAEQDRLTANARLDITRARIASETGAADAVSAWSSRRLADLPVGGFKAIPPESSAQTAVTAQHLEHDLYLISAKGFAPFGGHARAATGALVQALSLRELWLPFGAALEPGAEVHSENARITGADAAAIPPHWSDRDCTTTSRDSMKAVFGDTIRPGIAPVDAGLQDSTSFARLGPLSPTSIATVADRFERGSVHPAPSVQALACNTAAPSNWGDPLDPASPCGNYFPLIFADGDLTMSGGAGQGVLVVTRDLTLTDGAQFYGPILVAGDFNASPGSAVYGSVRARGKHSGITVRDAKISYNACAIFRALRAAPALDHAFRPGPRWWIPLF